MTLSEEAREKRNEYLRQWRRKNREKVNEYNRRYRANNPEKVREYNRRYWERKAQYSGDEPA